MANARKHIGKSQAAEHDAAAARASYAQALDTYQLALSMAETLELHSSVATICAEMAEGLEAVGRHGEAEALYERCVATEQRIYGTHAGALAISQYNLANCLTVGSRDAGCTEACGRMCCLSCCTAVATRGGRVRRAGRAGAGGQSNTVVARFTNQRITCFIRRQA